MSDLGICAEIVSMACIPALNDALAVKVARDAVRDAAVAAGAGPTADEPDEIGVVRYLNLAARGDLQSQRDLAVYGPWLVWNGDPEPLVTMTEALVFARLAAAQGNRDDRWKLVCLLAFTARLPDAGIGHAAEAIARLELLADEGHDGAARIMASGASLEDRRTIELASRYRDVLIAANSEEPTE